MFGADDLGQDAVGQGQRTSDQRRLGDPAVQSSRSCGDHRGNSRHAGFQHARARHRQGQGGSRQDLTDPHFADAGILLVRDRHDRFQGKTRQVRGFAEQHRVPSFPRGPRPGQQSQEITTRIPGTDLGAWTGKSQPVRVGAFLAQAIDLERVEGIDVQPLQLGNRAILPSPELRQIGRASCRERL